MAGNIAAQKRSGVAETGSDPEEKKRQWPAGFPPPAIAVMVPNCYCYFLTKSGLEKLYSKFMWSV